jgi:hypothetical protein
MISFMLLKVMCSVVDSAIGLLVGCFIALLRNAAQSKEPVFDVLLAGTSGEVESMGSSSVEKNADGLVADTNKDIHKQQSLQSIPKKNASLIPGGLTVIPFSGSGAESDPLVSGNMTKITISGKLDFTNQRCFGNRVKKKKIVDNICFDIFFQFS